MTRAAFALMAALALGACAQEDDDSFGYPPVETRYEITAAGVECRGTVDEEWTPIRHLCTWERVTVGGAPTCAAVLVFDRPDESAPWVLGAVFTSGADHCT